VLFKGRIEKIIMILTTSKSVNIIVLTYYLPRLSAPYQNYARMEFWETLLPVNVIFRLIG